MLNTRRDNRRVLVFSALIIATILVITLGRSGVTGPVVTLLTTPLKPVSRLLTTTTQSIRDMTAERQEYEELEAKIEEYERIIASLQEEVVYLREIRRDYDRLSGLVDYRAQHPDQNLVTADVIGRDTSSYLRWIIINRGTRDGIRVGHPVISNLGLVGRVERATAYASWVRLANDPGSAVNARLQRSGAEGTVIGQLQGGMRMEYIPQSELVEPGDVVLTSGLGGTFPPGIVIGRVTSVRRQQATFFQAAEVQSTVDFDSLDIVSVVTSFNPVDQRVFSDVLEAEEP
ncbi:MAG TPA: rod shape-determining protein MreC [Aggregatilineales bacterium]|nr:rod shape-determining protein MreC [Aggregatilineales bacterium]